MSIKAVILAAGEGSRMRPLTLNKPKVMLPLAGKPILEHLVLEMKKAGIEDLFIVTGYREKVIRDYFGDGESRGVRIHYRNQPERKGTGDAVRMVEDKIDDKFLVANGDILIDHRDIEQMSTRSETTIGVFEVTDTTGLGILETEGDRVIRVLEKADNPPTNLANSGFYLFTPEIFKAIAETPLSERGEYEITKSLQILIDSDVPVSCLKIERWMDVSYPWDLLSANEMLLKDMKAKVEGTIEEQVIIKGEVSIGKGSTVRSGSYITGPVIIGENCDIGPNCFIRSTTVIGNGCHIGASVEVKNSIVMNGSKIPHLNYVGDSVIGEDCNLGAGTKVANLKLDKKNISIEGKDTGRQKLGVIMGDGVQTGINSSINTGTVIGAGTLIGPGTMVSGIIPERSRAFNFSRPKTRKSRQVE